MIQPFKKFFSRMLHMSILAKLMISLFIIVIPLYAFNYYVNEIGAEKNREEITSSLLNTIQSHNNLLESELHRIDQMLTTTALDIALTQIDLLHPGVPYYKTREFISYVQKQLRRIQYSSLFIENTTALLPFLDLTINVSTPNSDIDPKTFQALSKNTKLFSYWNDELYLNVPYVYRNDENDGLFILAVKLLNVRFEIFLSNMMNFDHAGAVLFHLNEDWKLTSRNADEQTARELKELLTEIQGAVPYQTYPQLQTINMNGVSHLVVFDYSNELNTILAAYVPTSEVFSSLVVYREFFWTMSILSIIVILLFSIWTYKIIHKPLRTLVNGFRRVEIGSLQFKLEHRHKDEFGYLYYRFNEMVSNLNTLIHTVYEQKFLNQRSELKRLQSQINPHFLYNNFYVLQRLISLNHNKKASQFTSYLSQYFEFITRDTSDEIELKREVEHAKVYIGIQSVCLDNRVTVIFEPLPIQFESILVPRLILQPIIENCYQYVFDHMVSDGMLTIRFLEDDTFRFITIEDNGSKLTNDNLLKLKQKLLMHQSDTDETTGMINVHRRIQLKFGNQSGLDISRSSLGGLKTRIMLQKRSDL